MNLVSLTYVPLQARDCLVSIGSLWFCGVTIKAKTARASFHAHHDSFTAQYLSLCFDVPHKLCTHAKDLVALHAEQRRYANVQAL